MTPTDAVVAVPRTTGLRRRWRWMTWVPIAFIAVIVVCAIFPGAIAPYNPNIGKLEEFLGRFIVDLGTTVTGGSVMIGHRLGCTRR